MKVTLLKQWGDHPKDSELEITDVSVLKVGQESGVFKLSKPKIEVKKVK